MKIAILGCGGVGGYYGGMLARYYSADSQNEIIFIARGNHLEAIRVNGLKICTPESEFFAHPNAATDVPAEFGVFDLLLVCVKTYDITAALELVRSNVGAQTSIIPLVNGIEGFEIIRKKFPAAHVFCGCCYLNSFVEAPGVIKFRGGFAQVQLSYENAELQNKISGLLSAAGIDVYAAADCADKVWEKFIFGSVLSGIGSLKNESFGEIAASPERRQLTRAMMNEVYSVAIAKGIKLPATIVETLLSKISTFPLEARTSMQLDFTNGKRTELETFIGYVIRCADELKIEVPEYKKVYATLSSNN